ncbi:MAG: hypothetical protein JXQ72_13345 [Anaerolineae bacterium]|nr:hypothetical protein [Anaerolineae bacterium]
MRIINRACLVLLALAVGLSACTDAGSGSGGSSGLKPTPQLTLAEADRVATTFLTAWQDGDYATMYSLISVNSRDAYRETDFADEYEYVAEQMTTDSLTATITGSLRQGTTAAIQYDVTFTTNFFGEILDPGRTMRLIETPEGWRVAWSRIDILEDLAAGARLDRRQTLPGRGNIYDRNGNVLVDQNGRAVGIRLVKQEIPNMASCLDLLSSLLRKEYGELEAAVAQYNSDTLFLIGETDPDTFQNAEQALRSRCAVGDDPNDTFIRTTRRYYGELAPHLIGYIGQIQPEQVAEYSAKGYPSGALIGQAGIEQAYEEYLAGKPGGKLVIVAPSGETLREIAEADPEPGQSVYLSIDRDLQAAVQDAFIEAYNYASPTWGYTSKGGAAVVMEVKTGEILAMVSYPWFDPSLFNPDSPVWDRVSAVQALQSDLRTPLVNRVTNGGYPAGSIFKIVSTVAGLDSGVYPADTWYTCTAVWSHPEDVLEQRTDWIYGTGAHGTINFPQALTYSCDPYFWELSVALNAEDPDLLPGYAYKMGLGVPTGQDVLDEKVGYIPNPEDTFLRTAAQWGIGDVANLVIGQGDMLITPLQIARMTVAVANGGTLYKPLFVNRIGLIGEEPVYEAEPVPTQIDVDADIFALVREAMCQVTLDPNGTARYMFEDWYNFQTNEPIVCGKTGTAQTGLETTKPHAWFVAFTPRDDPEIAIAVMVENSCEGSEVAAPLTRRIIEDYYGLPHGELPGLWQTGCIHLGE